MPSGPAVTATLCTTSTDDEYELHVSVRGAPPPQLVEYWSRRSWFAKKLRTENGEVYDRNVGPNTPLKLSRGVNAQWKDGGLLYAPPLR